MKITRVLAAPAAVLLIAGLAACGSSSSDEASEASDSETVAAEETEAEAEAEADPTEAADLPEGEPGMDDEEDDTTAWTVTLDDTTYVVDMLNDSPENTFAAFGYEAPVILNFRIDPLEDVEAYREAVGEDEVGYVRLDADNREGIKDINISDVEVYDADGNTYMFEASFIPIGDWGPSWTGEYNENNEYEMSDGTWIPEEEYDALDEQGSELYDAHLDSDIPMHAKGTVYFIGDVIPEDAQIVAVAYYDSMEPGAAFPATPQD